MDNNIIQKHFSYISEKQKNQFEQMGILYKEWNKKINVISRKDIDNLYLHHILHSLVIAKIINFKSGSNILDLGTGGGFPGLPLAILFPKCNFVLVDSIGKKLKVVDDIAKQLGLQNIKTIHSRAESISGKYDFVVCRAVARLDDVWSWVNSKISPVAINKLPNGLIYLKGGNIDDELPKNVIIKKYKINDYFKEDYFEEKAVFLLKK